MQIDTSNLESFFSKMEKKINEGSTYHRYLQDKFSRYETICIFGMGALGKVVFNFLSANKLKVDFFCDNNSNKVGKKYKEISCVNLSTLQNNKESVLIIISPVDYEDIYIQLKENGYKNFDRIMVNKFEIDEYFMNHSIEDIKEKIIKLFDVLSDEESKNIMLKLMNGWIENEYKFGCYDDIYIKEQYFVEKIIDHNPEEIFVDCGAYNGDTLSEFVKYTKGNFNRAILYELNTNIFKELQINIAQYDDVLKNKIEIYNQGVSDLKQKIYYSDEATASHITTEGKLEGELINLDLALAGRNISFIKMDIEGAEMSALIGAKNLIVEQKPKLAICIYHSAKDYWEIPLFIKKLVPDYNIYIRHHTNLLIETVCYAIKRN